MKILRAGHEYILESLDGGETQKLTFVMREGDGFPFNSTSFPGTNCQEVLRSLIDRCEHLNNQNECAETEAIIGNLRSALLLFELRAARRHHRFLDLPTTKRLMSGPICSQCGHVQCTHEKLK